MKTLAEIRKRAWHELVANRTITVYDFVDGAEVNRRRPIPTTPFDRLAEAFTRMREAVASVSFDGLQESIVATAEKFRKFGEAFGTEIVPPQCAICGRPETYAHGEWFCRFCG